MIVEQLLAFAIWSQSANTQWKPIVQHTTLFKILDILTIGFQEIMPTDAKRHYIAYMASCSISIVWHGGYIYFIVAARSYIAGKKIIEQVTYYLMVFIATQVYSQTNNNHIKTHKITHVYSHTLPPIKQEYWVLNFALFDSITFGVSFSHRRMFYSRMGVHWCTCPFHTNIHPWLNPLSQTFIPYTIAVVLWHCW